MVGPALRVALVASLLVIAGCGSFGTADDSIDRDPYTVDEVVTPPPDEPERVLPGVTDSALVNPRALVETHAETLENSSYVIERNLTITYPNGSVAYRIRGEYVAAPGGLPRHNRINTSETLFDSPPRVVEEWITQNGTYIYSDESNAPAEYRYFEATPSPDAGTERITDVLNSAESVSVTTVRGTETRYVLEGRFTWENRDASFSMTVHEDGFVEEYTLVGEQPLANETGEKREHASFNRVGDPNVTLEQPNWVEAGFNGTDESETPEPHRNDSEPATETATETRMTSREGIVVLYTASRGAGVSRYVRSHSPKRR